MNDDVNVLALVKGNERYLFLYEDSQQADALRALGRQASNPELSFTWYDAAVLSKKIRSEAKAREVEQSAPTGPRFNADQQTLADELETPDFEELL